MSRSWNCWLLPQTLIIPGSENGSVHKTIHSLKCWVDEATLLQMREQQIEVPWQQACWRTESELAAFLMTFLNYDNEMARSCGRSVRQGMDRRGCPR